MCGGESVGPSLCITDHRLTSYMRIYIYMVYTAITVGDGDLTYKYNHERIAHVHNIRDGRPKS